jgi:L-threonylcarbamoyladenylate synthase
MTSALQVQTRRLTSSAEDIMQAAGNLIAGGLVAFPTETVYGLGADATHPEAVARLYAAKGRPHFNPLITHAASIEEAFRLGEFDVTARDLAQAFWPGPLTLVVPALPGSPVCELARAGLQSIAIRVPNHAVARSLITAAGRPIVAPSANRSGGVSPSLAEHVLSDLDGVIDALIDGGAAAIGVESTILGCLDGRITMLRPGGIPRAVIESVLGSPVHGIEGDGEAPLAPGRLASHYAPAHRLRLDATSVRAGEAFLAFGLPVPEGAQPALTLNLSEAQDLTEAAANLYRHLRALDRLAENGIAVAPVPDIGVGEAIRDRLMRAAAPR